MLHDFQNVFFRIVLDSDFRQQFFGTPERTLAPFTLTVAEQHALRALPPRSVEQFAMSLVQKRWGEVQQVMPLSVRVCVLEIIPDHFFADPGAAVALEGIGDPAEGT
jgi:hypothetical protein